MINALIAVLFVSLLSFVGFFTLGFQTSKVKELSFLLVSVAVGALFGDVFFHLLPELAEAGFSVEMGLAVVGGLLLFFGIEKFIHWRHCHIPTSEEHVHPFAAMNLIGDGMHNFLDGVLIAASFAVSPAVGMATTIAVVLHEIPQEIADFGVLVHAGLSAKKALLFNFFSGLTAVVGTLGYYVFAGFEGVSELMIPITIGGSLYIAGSDLVPELHKETKWQRSVLQVFAILIGLGLMWGLLALE